MLEQIETEVFQNEILKQIPMMRIISYWQFW